MPPPERHLPWFCTKLYIIYIIRRFLSRIRQRFLSRLKKFLTPATATAGVLLLSLSLTACGNPAEATLEAPQGVFVDTRTETLLQNLFDRTKACTKLLEGSFDELSVVLMPPTFPCTHSTSGICAGSFQTPNLINIGTFYAFDHEVIHYLLLKNTDHLDETHTSPLFNDCNIDPMI